MDRPTPPPPARPLHVLVLNDEPETLMILATWFETHGHTTAKACVTAMRDPEQEVAQLARTERADAVVYDIGYPYEANWRLLETLRSHLPQASVPIIATTSSRRALEAGPPSAGVIELDKSEDLDDLLAAVYRATGTIAGASGDA
jgi:CheY-like chemotaxis protein